jgi:hypothetical protein
LVWNGGITHSTGNIQDAVKSLRSGNQQLNLLGSKNKNVVVGYLQANNGSSSQFSAADYRTAVMITNYGRHPDLQTRTESLTYDMIPSKISSLPKPFGESLATAVNLALNISKLGYQLIVVFLGIYGLFIFYRSRRDKESEIDLYVSTSREDGKLFKAVQDFLYKKGLSDSLYELFGLTFASLLLAIFFRASTFIGNIYNTDRAAFQISLVWILPFALFFEFIFQSALPRFTAIFVLVVLSAGSLFFHLGLSTLYNGTYISKISAVNSIADATIISAEENFSAQWTCQRLTATDFFQSDSIASVNFGKYPCASQALLNVAPFVLDQNAFIFSNRANTLAGVTYDGFLFRRFNFPLDYIEQYYTPVYASDSTRLYH